MKLITEVIDYQMSNERKVNKHIKDYLQMTFRVTNEYTNKQWSDAN